MSLSYLSPQGDRQEGGALMTQSDILDSEVGRYDMHTSISGYKRLRMAVLVMYISLSVERTLEIFSDCNELRNHLWRSSSKAGAGLNIFY